jgi:hypothetical protein
MCARTRVRVHLCHVRQLKLEVEQRADPACPWAARIRHAAAWMGFHAEEGVRIYRISST